MRDYELELIASLAEGSLQDETEARALIQSSPEHRAEYEAQLAALESLRDMTSVHMSETEKAAMHRDVWSALRQETETPRARAPWFYRWMPTAAALLVVVGVLSVLPRGGGDASDESSDATVTMNAEGGDIGESAGGEDGGQAAVPPASPDDDSAALAFGTEVQRLRDTASADFMAPASEDVAGDGRLTSCVTTALSEEYTVLGTIPDPTAPERAESYYRPSALIVAVPTESDLAQGPVALVNQDTCELVHLEE